MRSTLKIVIIGLLIVSFSFAVVSSAGNGKRVIFDNSVGFFGLDNDEATGFTELRNDLELMGYSVSDTLELKANYEEITPKLLRKAGILVLINPIRPLSYSERQEIRKYVAEGGKLLLICDDPAARENANDIARDYGVQFLGRYIDSTEISFNGNRTELHSAMPMKYDGEVEPEVGFKINTTARAWESFWEIGEELPAEEYYLFLGMWYGKGKVAFLSDKDFLLNYNYDENSSAVFKEIISWLEYGKPIKPEKPGVSISSDRISMSNYYGTTSFFRFFVSNPTSMNETVNIALPEIMRSIVNLDKYSFELPPSSMEDVLATARCPQNVSYIYDYLNITASAQNLSTSYLLPVEVRCYAAE